MKKIYIDQILKSGDLSSPGPGRYDEQKSFGKKGVEYSMANRLNHIDQQLDKSKKLPGPGQYGAGDLCGTSLTNSAFVNPKNFSIGHEQRFSVPTKKTDMVAPVSYKPMDNLN
jgi:hypothetical protein